VQSCVCVCVCVCDDCVSILFWASLFDLICSFTFLIIIFQRTYRSSKQSPVPPTYYPPPSLSLLPSCAGTHNCVVSKKQISGEGRNVGFPGTHSPQSRSESLASRGNTKDCALFPPIRHRPRTKVSDKHRRTSTQDMQMRPICQSSN
jgi:hypothetical protein